MVWSHAAGTRLLVLLVVSCRAVMQPSETLKRAMSTNSCPGGCVNEDEKCTQLKQCNPRTANVTLAYSGLRDQLVGSGSGYSKLTAPAMPTEVYLALTVDRIYAADASVPYVELGVTQQLWWQDSRLRWTPAVYKGVDMLFFVCDPDDKTTSEIWSPDVQLWNAVEDSDATLINTRCYVAANGTVVWTRPGTMKVACDLAVSDFPFDTPDCKLQMGSWSQSAAFLRTLSNPWIGGARLSIDPGYGEMKMTAATAQEVTMALYADQASFSMVEITVSLERAFKYYTSRFMLPQMAITLVSFAASWVPPACKERLVFGGLLVACEVLIAVMVAPRIPVVDSTVAMSTYVAINLYFAFAALLVSCMSSALWHKSDRFLFSCTVKAPPRWLPPEDVRSQAEIEVANRAEFEKLQRCQVQTDLTSFFLEKKMEKFEQVFREQEIHTVEELRECRLSEEDLRDVFKIEPLYTRKVLARHIRELQPKEEKQDDDVAHGGLIGALVNTIQQGIEGEEEDDEEDEFVAVVGKPPPLPEPEKAEDPDQAFDHDDFSEYWQTWSAQMDVVARAILPVAYLVCVALFSGIDIMKLF